MTSPIIAEAKYWSDVPAVIAQYNQMIGETGTTNFFVYGSLIKGYKDIKPESSCRSSEEGGVANQQARLNGEVVAFDVIAYGENAFRASFGHYIDAKGEQAYFSNMGAYSGLEPSKDGYADGLNVGVNVQDRRKAWSEYIGRELTKPPAGISFDDLLYGTASDKLQALKGTKADKLGMYKLQIVNVETDQGIVPSITVATNDTSPFEFIQRTPMQIAHLILDGQGYRRPNGPDKFIGGSALDYFKSVLTSRRELGFKDPKMEQIAAAVNELAGINAEWDEMWKKYPDGGPSFVAAAQQQLKRHPALSGISSIRYLDATEVRDPVPDEVKALPENQIPRTAADKVRRIAGLHRRGETHLTQM